MKMRDYTCVNPKKWGEKNKRKQGGRYKMDCLKFLSKSNMKKSGLFAAGVLFGTAGIKVLASDDRAKECVMKTAAKVQENAEDIYAEAQQVNEDRAAKAEAVADAEEVAEETAEETEEVKEEEA